MWQLKQGNCKELIKDLEDNSIDSIVTDPPYELGFMGKKWDNSGIAYDVELWAECLRVLKHGGHLLAFGGSRTYHRMAVAIEDAGFEIRDQIQWVYGSGFPKSHNISKGIDKSDAVEMRRHRDLKFTEWMRSTNLKARQIDEITQSNMGGHYLTDKEQPTVATAEMFDKLRPHLPEVPEWVEQMVRERTIESENFKKREVIGTEVRYNEPSGIVGVGQGERELFERKITISATPAAKQYDGWGTALKPAHEPICVARKPFTGTVAENVLKYGTGGINIDGCRVLHNPILDNTKRVKSGHKTQYIGGELTNNYNIENQANRDLGRWPANFIHDGSEEVLAGFPDVNSGIIKIHHNQNGKEAGIYGAIEGLQTDRGFGDSGSASRFFYCAKASKKDRDDGCEELDLVNAPKFDGGPLINPQTGKDNRDVMARNHHPTVKPTDLMRYLCRLVTPPNGIILDPFTGSGSTGKAAILEGFRFVGFDMQSEYIEIASARIKDAEKKISSKLF